MHIAVCRACRLPYTQSRSDQRYCSAACREQGRSLGVSGGVLTRDVILFREQVRRLARRGDVGYRLLLFELETWFPLPGRSRRWGGGWRTTPHYSLNPFEPPRVPLEANYMLAFISPSGGFRYPDPPHHMILVTFPEHMDRVPALVQSLAKLKKTGVKQQRDTPVETAHAASSEPPPNPQPASEAAPHQAEEQDDAEN